MEDSYTMEEYYNAVDENKALKKELLDIKVEHAFSRNSEVRKELQKKINEIMKKIKHNIHIISSYKFNKKEKEVIENAKHKRK